MMLYAPFEKPWWLSWTGKNLELASRRLCLAKDERETWRFLTCEFFGSLFVIVSIIDCAGLLPELCWSVARPRLRVTCKDSLYFLTQQDAAPWSLAYRLVTCHNSHDSHRLDFESFRQHGISDWAPEGSSPDSCLVVMMWLCNAIKCSHYIGNVAIGFDLMRLCYLDELDIWFNRSTELTLKSEVYERYSSP